MFQPLLGSFDHDLVVAINNCHSEWMDDAVMIVTNFWFFVVVICMIIAYSFYHDCYPKALLFCALLVAVVGATDFLCASVIRPAVQQLRPTDADNPIHTMLHIVRGYTGGKYGFPSCHAANSFAIAVFSALWFRKRWIAITLILWSLAECYTRLYLGVHYPSDILGGVTIGGLMAFTIRRVSTRLFRF